MKNSCCQCWKEGAGSGWSAAPPCVTHCLCLPAGSAELLLSVRLGHLGPASYGQMQDPMLFVRQRESSHCHCQLK